MELLDSRNRILTLLSRCVVEVEGAASVRRTDIARASEDVLLPIFKALYDCPDLRNLNADEPDYPAVDLADDTARCGLRRVGIDELACPSSRSSAKLGSWPISFLLLTTSKLLSLSAVAIFRQMGFTVGPLRWGSE